MSDVISMRLDVIRAHLERVNNFPDLDEKRFRDLEDLEETIGDPAIDPPPDGTMLAWVRSIESKVADADIAVTGAISLSQKSENPIDKLRIASVDLKEAKKYLESLDTMVTGTYAMVTESSLQRHRVATGKEKEYTVDTEDFAKKVNDIEKGSLADACNHVSKARDAEKQGHTAAADKAWADAWDVYRKNVYDESQKLFRDYVDFVRGLATRDVLLDESYCQLADEMIRRWRRPVPLTIPAMQEALEDTVTRLVRLGFRDWSIWALPLVAREVGFAVDKKRTDRLGAFLARQQKKGHSEGCLRDYVADVFATCAMGPAYCFAAVYLRLDPFTASEAASDHPRDTQRAEVIFATLDWMNRNAEGKPYQGILETLREKWQAVLAQAGQRDCATPEERKQLRKCVEALADNMEPTVFSKESWDRANELKARLITAAKSKSAGLEAEKVTPDKKLDPPTAVLNAAWLARNEKPDLADEIKVLAKDAFTDLVGLPPERKHQVGKQPGGPTTSFDQ